MKIHYIALILFLTGCTSPQLISMHIVDTYEEVENLCADQENVSACAYTSTNTCRIIAIKEDWKDVAPHELCHCLGYHHNKDPELKRTSADKNVFDFCRAIMSAEMVLTWKKELPL